MSEYPSYVHECPHCGCPADTGTCPECGACDPHEVANLAEESQPYGEWVTPSQMTFAWPRRGS